MFTSWVRRKSLKKISKSRFLTSGTSLSPVMLLSIVGLMVVVGAFVVSHSFAAQRPSVSAHSLMH